jgi:hypothetical protein
MIAEAGRDPGILQDAAIRSGRIDRAAGSDRGIRRVIRNAQFVSQSGGDRQLRAPTDGKMML